MSSSHERKVVGYLDPMVYNRHKAYLEASEGTVTSSVVVNDALKEYYEKRRSKFQTNEKRRAHQPE